MNWKFWQKKPVAIAPVMSPVEHGLLDNIYLEPGRWLVREWKEGAVRADSRGVTIVSVRKSGVTPGPFGFPFPFDTFTASCGSVVFSPEFAARWHKVVSKDLEDARNRASEIEKARTLATLNDLFAPA